MNKESELGGMSLIVKTVTRLTFGLILLFGVYIAFHGHLSPGGGFAGGVILALAYTNLMLAFGKDVALGRLSKEVASVLEGFGGLVFVTLAVAGLIGGYLFLNMAGTGTPFALFSGGMILVYNVFAILLKVGAGLFSVVVALILMGPSGGRGK